MKDIITAPGFRHIPPRDRLVRHCLRKLADRFDWQATPEEYEALVEEAESFKGALAPDSDMNTSREVQLWPGFRGGKARVIYDREYRAVVTVVRGWDGPTVLAGAPRGARRQGRPKY